MMRSYFGRPLAITLCALVTLAISAGVAVGAAAPMSSRSTVDESSQRLLQTAPFSALTPAKLPAGTRLMRVQPTIAANGAGDVDLEYLLPDGRRLHLWETTRLAEELHGKDPTQLPGAIHTARQARWVEGTGFSGRVVTLAARIGSILVSVDASMKVSELLEIADSVR